MHVPFKITTDYSLLKSIIKIDSLIETLKMHHFTSCALCDEYLYGVMEFYDACCKNNIKPIIGLEIELDTYPLYLYAKNYTGYQNLLKLNTIKSERKIEIEDIIKYSKDVLCILPYISLSFFEHLSEVYQDIYLGFSSDTEYQTVLLKTKKVVYVEDIRTLKEEDIPYLQYVDMMRQEKTVATYEKSTIPKNYLKLEIKPEYANTTIQLADLINFEIPKNERHIPKYIDSVNSIEYLKNLSHKGLNKRLKGIVPSNYQERLNYELDVIIKMGFADYILIVYDYVLYAKKNNILVGPGRGSAAGSLICYSLGITDIDPIKYDLLFERFLNPERITMPDIDIDFENTKRGEVIEYLKERYGKDKVASIMTFSTLKSKLVLREVIRLFDIQDKQMEKFLKLIDSTKNLHDNYLNPKVQETVKKNKTLMAIYKVALKLEGLKKNISTHAAGVVISDTPLDEVIPILHTSAGIETGVTMEYLEELGLLKMDLLALKNLTIIASILDLIEKDTGKRMNLNAIDLNDKEVLKLFSNADTTGIFQFESAGMRSFLEKLKPNKFEDLISSLALYRPGPMDNINSFIKRRNGTEKIEYIIPELKEVLEETAGIIVYQEQVMQLLRSIGHFTFSESDLIRRAMSKKKKEIILENRNIFIENALQNGYQKEAAERIYDLILKFASYGFNKSHSVSYALVAYQMAFLKVKFPTYFFINLLNMSIGSESKTSEYIKEIKNRKITIAKPHVNKSRNTYYIENNTLIMPFSIIKGLTTIVIDGILEERNKNGDYLDFIDFTKRNYKKMNKKILENLIKAGIFEDWYNKTTLLQNLDNVLNYAEIASDLEEHLIMPPKIKPMENDLDERSLELENYGFYITNHPVSRYNRSGIVKLENIKPYFDKYIQTIILVENIKTLKNKNNENMAFITGSDETDSLTFVVFARQFRLLENLSIGDIVLVSGRVTKRFDKYQINVNNIIKGIEE